MRFLLISLFFISLTSCKLGIVANYTKLPAVTELVQNQYFSDISKDYIYKSSIDVYGRHFGGIVIIKKQDKNHHRVVFTTEFGSKVFDFEFINDDFKINFILEELNKKILVNTLKKDFRLLLKEDINSLNKYQDDKFLVYKEKIKNRYNYYFKNRKNQFLEKLVHASKTREKVIINFESDDGKVANRIIVQHKNIKLKIELKYIG